MFSYILLVVSVIIFFIVLLVTIYYIERFRMSSKIVKFDSYAAVLLYHMEKAFDIIYKDRMLIYSIEATRVNDKEFDSASKDFVYLVLKMIGPSLKEEFVELYGDEETLVFILIEYFNTRNETDTIREKARENLFNDSKIFKPEEEKKLF
jgi:sRNA-binding regulator protein Hfq